MRSTATPRIQVVAAPAAVKLQKLALTQLPSSRTSYHQLKSSLGVAHFDSLQHPHGDLRRVLLYFQQQRLTTTSGCLIICSFLVVIVM